MFSTNWDIQEVAQVKVDAYLMFENLRLLSPHLLLLVGKKEEPRKGGKKINMLLLCQIYQIHWDWRFKGPLQFYCQHQHKWGKQNNQIHVTKNQVCLISSNFTTPLICDGNIPLCVFQLPIFWHLPPPLSFFVWPVDKDQCQGWRRQTYINQSWMRASQHSPWLFAVFPAWAKILCLWMPVKFVKHGEWIMYLFNT